MTVGELWDYNKTSSLKLTSIHLYKNPIKQFHPYLYWVQFISSSFNNIKGCNLLKTNTPNGIYTWKVWKAKINKEKAEEVIELSSYENNYKEILMKNTMELIKIIETNDIYKVQSIESAFVICHKSI